MNPQRPSRWAGLLAALVLCGCNATQARIDDNQELFDTYPPEVQAMIRSNRIDVGFDPTQVWMALGNADRTTSADGREVWSYHVTASDTVREEKTASEFREEWIAYENAREEGRDVAEPSAWRTVRLYRTRVEREVHFDDGRVTGWDEPEEMWLDDWHR